MPDSTVATWRSRVSKAGLEFKFITACQNPWEVANVFLADITVRPS